LALIVCVDDEDLTRMVASDALCEAGHKVMGAADALEALAILRTHSEIVSALFTDVHMPGDMDGLALAHYTHRTWPWIAILIASGQAHPKAEELPPASKFLTKPYRLRHAVSHINLLIAEKRRHSAISES
jgi:CheY-like chemotaxis protein